MVVDTSALVAYLLAEPERARLLGAMQEAPTLATSAVALVEASMVLLGRRGEDGARELDALLDGLGIVVAPATRATAVLARNAFDRYGKGRHPAALNFGDCFSYALAKERGEPLLFVGNDFSRTDVAVAPY
ncbi:ribonuclease VapC [Gemmatimonadetes bacterium T265]|nr:ribonuclease VapC [Gemmatimonadetes bacterium T265]